MNSQHEKTGISRRQFVIGATSSALAVAGASALPAQPVAAYGVPTVGIPDNWDMETDVVVVGTGSGLAAAIEAVNAGSEVIVIDKADHVGGLYITAGGSCTMGGGTIVQQRAGVEDDMETWYDAEMAASDHRGIPEMIRTYVEMAPDTVQWLEDLGLVWGPITDGVLPTPPQRGHAVDPAPGVYEGGTGTAGSGVAWTTVLQRRVEEQGTPILLKHRMMKIYREPNGPVVGIEVDNEGRLLNIKARKAVIIATGGYTDNEALCAAWDPRIVGPETFGDGGIPGYPKYIESTGDGLFTMMDVGAGLTDMSFVSFLYLFYGSKTYWGWEPRDWSKFNLLRGRGLTLAGEKTQRLILVKNDGARYVNESAEYNADIPELEFTTAFLNLKERPRNVWAITDADGAADLKWTAEMFANADPLAPMCLAPDCLATADTLAELAEKIGIPEEGLAATIEKYNGFVDAGADADFGKPLPLYKLGVAPFFAAKLNLIRHTQVGGVRINTKTQVLDRADTVGTALPVDQMKTIPHLYATGEVAGGSLGWRRVHNKIGHYISFARIAGMNAAAEEVLA